MTGVARQDRGHPARHRFHGDEIGAAFAAAGQQRDIDLAQQRRGRGVGERTKIDERAGGQAIHRQPARDIETPVRHRRRTGHMRRAGEALRRLRPWIVPGGDEQRVRVACVEFLERRHDEVLAFAVFELAAGENGEASGETAAPRPGREEVEIDALETVAHIRKPMAPQDLGVPAGPGDDQGEAPRGVDIGLGDGRGLEEDHADVRRAAQRGQHGRKIELVAESVKDGETGPDLALGAGGAPLRVTGERAGERFGLARGQVQRRGDEEERGFDPPARQLSGEIGAVGAPAAGHSDLPADADLPRRHRFMTLNGFRAGPGYTFPRPGLKCYLPVIL